MPIAPFLYWNFFDRHKTIIPEEDRQKLVRFLLREPQGLIV